MMIIKVYPDYIKVHYDNKLTRAMIGPMYKVHDDNINVQDDNVNAYENHNLHDGIVKAYDDNVKVHEVNI